MPQCSWGLRLGIAWHSTAQHSPVTSLLSEALDDEGYVLSTAKDGWSTAADASIGHWLKFIGNPDKLQLGGCGVMMMPIV